MDSVAASRITPIPTPASLQAHRRPGLAALDATLSPAETGLYYFVARPDGTHVFSRTLVEHNRAVAQIRFEWDQYRREQREGAG